MTRPSAPRKSRAGIRRLVRSCSELPPGNYPGELPRGPRGGSEEDRGGVTFPRSVLPAPAERAHPREAASPPNPRTSIRAPLRGPQLGRPGWHAYLHPLTREGPARTRDFKAFFRIRAKCLKHPSKCN